VLKLLTLFCILSIKLIRLGGKQGVDLGVMDHCIESLSYGEVKRYYLRVRPLGFKCES